MFTPKAASSLTDLGEELKSYRCIETACHQHKGGNCFENNFDDGSDVDWVTMKRILLLFREKTRCLNNENKNTYIIELFKRHCSNLSDVISPTEEEATSLFGKTFSDVVCGACNDEPPCICCDDSFTIECSSSSSSSLPTSLKRKREPQKPMNFKMNWDVVVDSRRTLSLCREAFCFLYGISPSQFF